MKKILCVLFVLCAVLLPTFATSVEEEDSAEGVVLEIYMLDGGWGLGFFEAVGAEMEAAFPGITVEVGGSPRVVDEIRPRFIAGDPPDVGQVNGPTGRELARAGQLVSLNGILDTQAYDQDMKFIDTFLPGALVNGQIDGEYYMGPNSVGMTGLWYDQKLFDDHGWEVPETWEAFLSLAEEIKAAGIAPLTYQGIYPSYMDMMITPLLYTVAGEEALFDIDNLVPGAWKNPKIMEALQMVTDFVAGPGNTLEGTEGLNHTGAQMEWLNRNAAFIPVGTWIENEMKDVTPDDFEMRMMLVPGPADSIGDATALASSYAMAYVIPADGDNPDWALEYFKIMYSKKMAQWFAENVGSVLPVKGGTEGVEISQALASALALLEDTDNTISIKWWYPTIQKVYLDNIAEFMWGRMSVDEYTDLLEAKSQAVAGDDTIDKLVRE